jgi:hypothetical protein
VGILLDIDRRGRKLLDREVHVYEHYHAEIRGLSLKKMGYAPSVVIGAHLITR